MTLREAVNGALRRTTGYQLQKRAARGEFEAELREGDRLLEAPAFILCSVRSGSTLLRVLLDSHSEIHSPHELHLRDMRVRIETDYAERSLAELGLGRMQLEYLLWDRVLHRELAAAGKRLLVNKTPNDAFAVERIRECWPDARFIFLLRNPAAVARSRAAARPQDEPERNVEMVRRYVEAVEEARTTLPGHTVRYEDLAADPEGETRRLCDFLGVGWERAMLDYGALDHGPFRSGLGDWSEKIKSGRVQPPAPDPDASQTPPELREVARAWGYLARPALADRRS